MPDLTEVRQINCTSFVILYYQISLTGHGIHAIPSTNYCMYVSKSRSTYIFVYLWIVLGRHVYGVRPPRRRLLYRRRQNVDQPPRVVVTLQRVAPHQSGQLQNCHSPRAFLTHAVSSIPRQQKHTPLKQIVKT